MGIQLSDRVENITNNFSFSHNAIKSCLLLMCQNEYLWNKGLHNGLLTLNLRSSVGLV